MTMITLTTGTAFIMWLGEQITERGICNGISLIIFASIVTGIPSAIGNYFAQNKGDIQPLTIAAVVGVIVLATIAVDRLLRARPAPDPDRLLAPERRPARLRRAERAPAAQGEHGGHDPADLRLVAAHVPGDARELQHPRHAVRSQAIIKRGDWVFNTRLRRLIVFFCYFYTAVTFQPVDVADNLKKQQANIPGIRPGKQTAEYIDRVLTRITFGGAMYVAAVCVVPSIISQIVPRAVPVRRHVAHDRRRRRARHGQPDRSAPHHAQLRRPHRPRRRTHPRAAPARRLSGGAQR